MERAKWRCIFDGFCFEPVLFDTIDELKQALYDAYGERYAITDDGDIRYYRKIRDDGSWGGTVFEGMEEFDYDEWLRSGANWMQVAEVVDEEGE